MWGHAFHAISALGELLGECHTTYIFVNEAELDQLPRPLRDQFRQLNHLVEWMMLQVFLTHEIELFPFSRYARMWYLVP